MSGETYIRPSVVYYIKLHVHVLIKITLSYIVYNKLIRQKYVIITIIVLFKIKI